MLYNGTIAQKDDSFKERGFHFNEIEYGLRPNDFTEQFSYSDEYKGYYLKG